MIFSQFFYIVNLYEINKIKIQKVVNSKRIDSSSTTTKNEERNRDKLVVNFSRFLLF